MAVEDKLKRIVQLLEGLALKNPSEAEIRAVKAQIARETYQDTELHAKFYFPDAFYAKFNRLHEQIIEWLNRPGRYKVLAAPRGLGKTTFLNLYTGSKNIGYRERKFMLYVTNNGDNAIQQTDSLKDMLLTSRNFRSIFGSITFTDIQDIEGLEPSFSKKVWQAFDTVVLPRGRGQQIRGLLVRGRRPDFILIDDLEVRELMNSDVYRKKVRDWFYSDVMKATSRYDKEFQIVYVDTLKHEDSLLARLLVDPRWDSLVLEACDENQVTADPTFMSQEEINEEYAFHEREGILDIFEQEFRNNPTSKQNAVFPEEFFRHCAYNGTGWHIVGYSGSEAGLFGKESSIIVSHGVAFEKKADAEFIAREECVFVVICDPAKTKNLKSADSALLCFGIHRSQQKLILAEERSGKFDPKELYENMFEMCIYWNARILAVEVTSLSLFISQPIETEIRLKGLLVEYVELQARGDKLDRIKELGIYYRKGWFIHSIEYRRKLEGQLRAFPRSKLVDVSDCAAYILQVMSLASMYFLPENMDEEGMYEDHYEELDKLYDEPSSYIRRI